jgi:hypothetical protein
MCINHSNVSIINEVGYSSPITGHHGENHPASLDDYGAPLAPPITSHHSANHHHESIDVYGAPQTPSVTVHHAANHHHHHNVDDYGAPQITGQYGVDHHHSIEGYGAPVAQHVTAPAYQALSYYGADSYEGPTAVAADYQDSYQGFDSYAAPIGAGSWKVPRAAPPTYG